jgi:hypothetical protein
MIPPLSRFGASLPAYSTRPAFTPTTENSKALGVSSRANTQRQGFCLVELARIAQEFGISLEDLLNKIKENATDDTASLTRDSFTALNGRLNQKFRIRYTEHSFIKSFYGTEGVDELENWINGRPVPTNPRKNDENYENLKWYYELLANPQKYQTWLDKIEHPNELHEKRIKASVLLDMYETDQTANPRRVVNNSIIEFKALLDLVEPKRKTT